MGMLVTLEGLDGSGKRTLTDKVVTKLRADGVRVATLAFPRYGESIHADLAAEALNGAHGDLAASVYAMAVLFALDRAAAKAHLRDLLADNDIVLLDRYVASNAAYNAARLREDARGDIVAWVAALEFDRLGLPVPDLQLLLDVPVEVAAARARKRGELDDARALDAYERDRGLQERTAQVYRQLAGAGWRGQWWTVLPDDDPEVLAKRLGGVASGFHERG